MRRCARRLQLIEEQHTARGLKKKADGHRKSTIAKESRTEIELVQSTAHGNSQHTEQRANLPSISAIAMQAQSRRRGRGERRRHRVGMSCSQSGGGCGFCCGANQ